MKGYKEAHEHVSFNDKLRALNEKQTYAYLDQKDTRLFYKLYFSVLDYVNALEQIIPNKKIDPNNYIEPDELVNLIEVFWKAKDRFIDYGMRKNFLLAVYEKNYTVLNDEGINYMVKGLNENLDKFIPAEKTPMLIQTAIMPFNGMIIYDGFISTADMQLSQELVSKAFEDYSYGQKIYSLLPKNMN